MRSSSWANSKGWQMLSLAMRNSRGIEAAHLPGGLERLDHVFGDGLLGVGAGVVEFQGLEMRPEALLVDGHRLQGLPDGHGRALDELGIDIGDYPEALVAGPADIPGADFGPGVGEAVGVEHAQTRQPPDVFPGEGVDGDEVPPAFKAGGGFGEHRGPGVFDCGQEPAVTGKQGVGEDTPAVMA